MTAHPTDGGVGWPAPRAQLGYGVRSYGPGSWLHMHRDRVDTHVVSASCMWPISPTNPGRSTSLTTMLSTTGWCLKPGTMLFYESLCPHGRASEFDGAFYRNMYFHWRPKAWDPAPYQQLAAKFATVEEACQSNQDLKKIASIPETWRDWLLLNQGRGCDREGMLERAMARGFARDALEAVLDAASPASPPRAGQDHGGGTGSGCDNDVKLCRSTVAPSMVSGGVDPAGASAEGLEAGYPLAQLYEIPDLLSREECEQVIEAINQGLQPSTVTRGTATTAQAALPSRAPACRVGPAAGPPFRGIAWG